MEKLKFTFEIEVPDAEELAHSTFQHIYEDDYYEDDGLETQLFTYLLNTMENTSYEDQIPIKYLKRYNYTLNKLKNDPRSY